MIIVKGRSRGDGAQLASYLSKKGDNGRIDLLAMRGFAREELRPAFRLAETESELSRGRKPFWHAQISPAQGVKLTREQQMMAVEVLEKRLGLKGQPRAVVLHEKDGREHLHVVWSRFDRETGRMARDSFTHVKNVLASAEIAVRLGLEPNRNPFADRREETLTREDRRELGKSSDTHAELQQNMRATKPRGGRKAEISDLWAATDSGQAFAAALDQAGYTLAQGSRGFVVVDAAGEVHSLARQIENAHARDVRNRFSDISLVSLPRAEDIRVSMRQAQAERAREQGRGGMPDLPHHRPTPVETNIGADAPIGSGPAEAASREPSPAINTDFITASQAHFTPWKAPEESKPSEPQISAHDVLEGLTRHHSTFTRRDLARAADQATGGGGHELWMMRTGGLDALDEESRRSVERSYANWAAANPELAHKIGVARYVAYVQGKQSERDAADPEALRARKASKVEFDKLMAEIAVSDDLLCLGPDHTGRERFTTRDMLALELRMQAAAATMATRQGHAVPSRIVDAVPGIDTLGAEQKAALKYVTAPGDLSLVVGFAGTGKSRTLGIAREAWEAAGLRVRGAALSGIAAEGLETDAGIQSRTLHSLLHQLDTIEDRRAALVAVDGQLAALDAARGISRRQAGHQNRERAYLTAKRNHMAQDLAACELTERDVLVVDEAAMVGSRLMERLMTHAEQAHCKVVLVGDHEQLQAIDAGAAFRALRDAHGAQELTEIRRQAGEERQWMRDATQDFGWAKTTEALGRYNDAGMVHGNATRADAKTALAACWTAARLERPEQTHIILAYTRADVAELNELARSAYRAEGRLGEDVALGTAQGDKMFASGDRVYFTRNDTRLMVKNGSLGSIAAIDANCMTVLLDNGRSVDVDVTAYGHITHGYAATVHKSQGVTVDRAHVLASRYMDRHAAYVGMTRHRDRADLYFGEDEFKSFDILAGRLSRNGAKDTTLDYKIRADRTKPAATLRAILDPYMHGHLPDRANAKDGPEAPKTATGPREPSQNPKPQNEVEADGHNIERAAAADRLRRTLDRLRQLGPGKGLRR